MCVSCIINLTHCWHFEKNDIFVLQNNLEKVMELLLVAKKKRKKKEIVLNNSLPGCPGIGCPAAAGFAPGPAQIQKRQQQRSFNLSAISQLYSTADLFGKNNCVTESLGGNRAAMKIEHEKSLFFKSLSKSLCDECTQDAPTPWHTNSFQSVAGGGGTTHRPCSSASWPPGQPDGWSWWPGAQPVPVQAADWMGKSVGGGSVPDLADQTGWLTGWAWLVHPCRQSPWHPGSSAGMWAGEPANQSSFRDFSGTRQWECKRETLYWLALGCDGAQLQAEWPGWRSGKRAWLRAGGGVWDSGGSASGHWGPR